MENNLFQDELERDIPQALSNKTEIDQDETQIKFNDYQNLLCELFPHSTYDTSISCTEATP